MKNTNDAPRQPAGISLVEMMITLTIFAVIALALADGLVVSMKSTSVNEERQAAMLKARERLNWVSTHKLLIVNSDPVDPPPTHTPAFTTPRPAYYPRFVVGYDANYGVIEKVQYFDTQTPPVLQEADMTFDVPLGKSEKAGTQQQPKLQPLFAGGPNPHGTLHGEKTGELVIMFDEHRIGGYERNGVVGYGRDLTGGPSASDAPFGSPNGTPDGVSFAAIGDMDMDGTPTAAGDGSLFGPSGQTSGYSTIIVNPGVAVDFRWGAFQDSPAYPAGGLKTDPVAMGGRAPIGAIVRWAGASGAEERVELWTVINFQQSNENNGVKGSANFLRYDN